MSKANQIKHNSTDFIFSNCADLKKIYHICTSPKPIIPIETFIVMVVIDSHGYVHHQHASPEGSGVFRSSRALRPQLGLGAVTRQPAAKARVQQTGQRSTTAPTHSGQAAQVSTVQDPAGEMTSPSSH